VRRIAWLILKELRHRWFNALLSVAALSAAVAIFVVITISQDAQQRETRRITRDMGFNLRIIPKATDMIAFWNNGFSEYTMPEACIARIAGRENISYNHLIATLQQRVVVKGQNVIVTGLADELSPPGRKKTKMVSIIDPGTVHVGFEAARQLGWKKGDEVQIGGYSFKVARSMPEAGNADDVRLILTLPDAQAVLDKPAQINEIKAIDCLCLTADENPLTILRSELSAALPEAKVVMLRDIAEARAQGRQMTDRAIAFTSLVVLVVVALWVGTLAMINVRQRRAEIGLLRALGYRGNALAGLILGKAILLGLVAAVVGSVLGTYVAVTHGPDVFPITAKAIRPEPMLFWWALAATPIFAAAVSFMPTSIAIAQDPAFTLRRD
jgi:putative ABC transport system permease protein